MVSEHLIFSTVLYNLDVLTIFSTDVMDGEGPNLACFKLPNNFTPQKYPIAGLEQEQGLRFFPFSEGLGGVKLSVCLHNLGNRFHTLQNHVHVLVQLFGRWLSRNIILLPPLNKLRGKDS